jgi:hypothetical protein
MSCADCFSRFNPRCLCSGYHRCDGYYTNKCKDYCKSKMESFRELNLILKNREQLLPHIQEACDHFKCRCIRLCHNPLLCDSSDHRKNCEEKIRFCILTHFSLRKIENFEELIRIIEANEPFDIIQFSFSDFFTEGEKTGYLELKKSDCDFATVSNRSMIERLDDALNHHHPKYHFDSNGKAPIPLLCGITWTHGNNPFCYDKDGKKMDCPYAEFQGHTIAQFEEAYYNIINNNCSQGPEL